MKFWLFVIGMMMAALVSAAPKAGSPQECAIYVDAAIVARALTVEGIPERARSRVLDLVYVAPPTMPAALAERILALIALVNEAAGRSQASPHDFAIALGALCTERHGNMDSMLGSRS